VNEGTTMINTSIRLVETDGQFFICIKIDDCELEKRGPFSDRPSAEAAAVRIGAVCRGMFGGNRPETYSAMVAPAPARKRRI
jgi:hypothetical protein